MMTTVTPLGNTVPVDDWKAFQGDVVLKVLYDYDSSGTPSWLAIEKLYLGTALSEDETREVVLYLSRLDYVIVSNDNVWLTSEGKHFVATCIDAKICPTCGR